MWSLLASVWIFKLSFCFNSSNKLKPKFFKQIFFLSYTCFLNEQLRSLKKTRGRKKKKQRLSWKHYAFRRKILWESRCMKYKDEYRKYFNPLLRSPSECQPCVAHAVWKSAQSWFSFFHFLHMVYLSSDFQFAWWYYIIHFVDLRCAINCVKAFTLVRPRIIPVVSSICAMKLTLDQHYYVGILIKFL